MDIKGLDYNTTRDKLIMPEYGREIQKMVDYCIALPDKEERQVCAETIVVVMARMTGINRANGDFMKKLWDHLAIMSNFQLDIDYPCDVSHALAIGSKPEPMKYPASHIRVRHYGNLASELFDRLKTMEPGEARDELAYLTAGVMKQDLEEWGHGSATYEKVVDDMARFTDGIIQLDPLELQCAHTDALQSKMSADRRKKKKSNR